MAALPMAFSGMSSPGIVRPEVQTAGVRDRSAAVEAAAAASGIQRTNRNNAPKPIHCHGGRSDDSSDEPDDGRSGKRRLAGTPGD